MAQIKNLKKPGDAIRGAAVGLAGLDKDGNINDTGIQSSAVKAIIAKKKFKHILWFVNLNDSLNYQFSITVYNESESRITPADLPSVINSIITSTSTRDVGSYPATGVALESGTIHFITSIGKTNLENSTFYLYGPVLRTDGTHPVSIAGYRPNNLYDAYYGDTVTEL